MVPSSLQGIGSFCIEFYGLWDGRTLMSTVFDINVFVLVLLGLEPRTFSLLDWRSNRLSYRTRYRESSIRKLPKIHFKNRCMVFVFEMSKVWRTNWGVSTFWQRRRRSRSCRSVTTDANRSKGHKSYETAAKWRKTSKLGLTCDGLDLICQKQGGTYSSAYNLVMWCNGSTGDFESPNLGSIPSMIKNAFLSMTRNCPMIQTVIDYPKVVCRPFSGPVSSCNSPSR